MKSLDPISAAQPGDPDGQPGYFSNGLLSKVIHSDQQLARPTEDVVRRRWVQRMFLAEVAFVIGVLLLQMFPVIEAPASATAAAAETATATATVTVTPTPSATAAVLVVAATVEPPQLTAVPTQSGSLVPAALPNTGRNDRSTAQLLVAPLLSIGAGLVVWLLAIVWRGDPTRVEPSQRSDDEGSAR